MTRADREAIAHRAVAVSEAYRDLATAAIVGDFAVVHDLAATALARLEALANELEAAIAVEMPR